MKRRDFLHKTGLAALGSIISTNSLAHVISPLKEDGIKMPVLFMGHGNPMNAVQDNPFTRGWADLAKNIPRPKAILIISAHWETKGITKVFAGEKPKMIYDMYGFPKNLYEVDYPSIGSPKLANQIGNKVNFSTIVPTHDWGLDHGAWSVLVKMFPDASIPCFQLSLNNTRDLNWHYSLAKELSFLRKQGVLIMGSGNIVHNLRYIRDFYSAAPEWALTFDQAVTQHIESDNHQPLIDYSSLGKSALISVNSAEHYIPMLYALALKEKDEKVTYSNHEVDKTLLGVGMRCLRIG